MGAWGYGSFQNDDTWDWLNEFFEKLDLETVTSALKMVAESDVEEYIELPECGAVVGAAEIVAALQGKPHPQLPEDVEEWVKSQSPLVNNEMCVLALCALERIKNDSEMQSLTEESGHTDEWLNEISNLEDRLRT